MSSRANIRRPRNAGHSRSATVGSTRRHKTKPSWSGTTRRNSIIGVTGGIGSGRVPLSKLNSITMSSKTRKDDDRNKHHHSEDDTMALKKLSFSLQAQHVPLDNSPPLQPPLPFAPVFNASMLQPPSPVQPPPNSAQRRKPKGFLDLSKFEYQPTTNSMNTTNTTNTTNTITTTNTIKTITSPSASQSISSSAPASPNSRKPPPPPGPPPPSAKRKTTTRPTCEPLLFSSKTKNVNQQYNDERASTITPSTLNVHEEMDAMRQRIADLTYEFKRRDEEQTVAIVVLQKQAKQLERANAHLRRERDRQMGLLQQRKNNHNHNNSGSNNKHATSTSSTTASTNSSRNSVGSRKSAMQIGLEKQLQLARQQLAKEKKNNASNVKLLAQSQQMLEVQIETLEQHAAAATQRVKQLERLMEQNESDARRWARDQAIAKTEKYQQQIQSLHRQLQEARSQLRASAAASLGQFDTASETTSPQIQYQTESMNSTPPRLDLMMATNNNNNNENENENGNESKNLVPSVVATRTPHPKRLPPPRPS